MGVRRQRLRMPLGARLIDRSTNRGLWIFPCHDRRFDGLAMGDFGAIGRLAGAHKVAANDADFADTPLSMPIETPTTGRRGCSIMTVSWMPTMHKVAANDADCVAQYLNAGGASPGTQTQHAALLVLYELVS